MSPWLFSGLGIFYPHAFSVCKRLCKRFTKAVLYENFQLKSLVDWSTSRFMRQLTNNIYKFDSDFCGNLYPINFNSSGAMKRVEATGLCENAFSLC